MTQFVIVEFAETRIVIIDDVPQGPNKTDDGEERILRVDEGLHTFSLEGVGFSPVQQDLNVASTNPADPMRVVFNRA